MTQMNVFTKQNRLTDTANELLVTKGEKQGEGQIRSLGFTYPHSYL